MPCSPGARRGLLPVILLCAACRVTEPSPSTADTGPGDVTDAPSGPVLARMELSPESAFWASPFPGEHRRGDDGAISLEAIPGLRTADYFRSVVTLAARDAEGFGLTSTVYFPLTGAPDESRLPGPHDSVREGSPVFLMAVSGGSPARLRRHPLTATYLRDGGPHGAPDLLALLPVQGLPLRPRTLYAAVVLRALGGARGAALEPSPSLTSMLSGTRPAGLSARAWGDYTEALTALSEAGVERGSIAGLTVFRTGDPAAAMDAFRTDALARTLPSPEEPFTRDEVFDDYCVYHTTLTLPVYQQGEAPYAATGGGWARDPSGRPVYQRGERARLVVTVPRRPMPAGGFPAMVFIRTGAGGERPLVDRGPHPPPDAGTTRPGSGPALELARAGFAGVSWDGPHGGLRNPTRGDEQFLVFNVANLQALRDNVRQTALEAVVLAHVIPTLSVGAAQCPGVVAPDGVARFDGGLLALMGHSMGATVAPLALAVEPRFRAVVLSGAGGSWIENILYKQRPLEVRPIAESLLRYTGIGRRLREDDPALALFQWALEPADPPVYAGAVVREPLRGPPRHVLMLQGIVDHYILPPIANATSLSLGLDLAGPSLDRANPSLARFTPLDALLDLAGRSTVSLPVRDNVHGVTGNVTAVVSQFLEDGLEDGHEVVFQTEAPRRAWRCFLQGLALGAPEVPAPAGYDAPCGGP